MSTNFVPGEIGKLRPPVIPVKIGLVSTFLASVAALLFAYLPKHRDLIGFTAAAAGAAGGVTGAFYIGQNIQFNLDLQRKERALSAISFWTEPGFANTVRSSLRKIGDELDNESNRNKHPEIVRTILLNDKVLEENIITVLNILEQMAVALEQGMLDETLTRNYFETIIIRIYDRLSPWIHDRRKLKDSDDLFIYLERLSSRWGKEKNGESHTS